MDGEVLESPLDCFNLTTYKYGNCASALYQPQMMGMMIIIEKEAAGGNSSSLPFLTSFTLSL